MIGTLIGDLAAWTYENDPTTFWQQLIPDDGHGAVPSVYGHALMKAASHNIMDCPGIDTNPIGTPMDGCRYSGQKLMWHIVGAWIDRSNMSGMPVFHSIDKDEHYATMFVMNLIMLLRGGATKSEAYHTMDSFEHMSKHWNWRTPGKQLDLITYVLRAWNAFYHGHDYTSTIHNAVKWSDDRNLTCALAGTFADAMYGCQFNIIKKKYAINGETTHRFGLLSTGERNNYHPELTHEMASVSISNRSFSAKNNVLTNVEWHKWENSDLYLETELTSEDRDNILKGRCPGWENRFSLYLDDGWIYCCRSGFLLSRFKIEKNSTTHNYRIVNIQLSGEVPVDMVIAGLDEALPYHVKLSMK